MVKYAGTASQVITKYRMMASLVGQYITYLNSLVSQGGPRPEQDEILCDTLQRFYLKYKHTAMQSHGEVAQRDRQQQKDRE